MMRLAQWLLIGTGIVTHLVLLFQVFHPKWFTVMAWVFPSVVMLPWRVVVQHALPNALAPIVNVVVLNLAYLIVGVVVVEVVFIYPGLGQLMVDSVSKRDVPVVQATCMIFAATYITLNLVADVLTIACDPRQLHPR